MADQAIPAAYSPTDYLKKPYKLLRPGADATITDKDGNGAFHYLAQSDMFEDPETPEEKGFGRWRFRPPSPVDDPSLTMEGLIHSLLAAGADINLQNKNGETALHFQVSCRLYDQEVDEKLCESLCQAGADLNIRDRRGRSAVFSLLRTCPDERWNRDKCENLCQLVLRYGGRFDVRDNQGQTLIHSLFVYGGAYLSLVEALARHGVDASAVDNEGNTLWHAAVSRLDESVQKDKQLVNLLLRLGADPRKPNKSGRNPLHALSSSEAPYFGSGLDRSCRLTVFPACISDLRTTGFDYLLQMYVERGYDLDVQDNQGITPLHLTSTFSEYQTWRLLQAGADPKISTHEGLTPFHLAARCRQSNIIGLLLDKAKRDESESDGRSSSSMRDIVNAKDAYGRSPLYYACASGRAENVALLLNAGASVQSDEYSGSVWQACAQFEEELLNWSSSPGARSDRMTASGVLIDDKTRTIPKRDNKFPREDLWDVLRLLIQHQDSLGAMISYLDKAISVAAAKQHDYTVWCLVRARDSLEPGTASATADECTLACLARVNALGITQAAIMSPQDLRAEFERLMGLRRHDLVQSLILEHGWGELDWDGNTFIHDLARSGFASVLRGLTPLVKELSAKLEDVEWCDAQKLASSKGPSINYFPMNLDQNCAQGSTQPLLLVACRSEEPNMEVVKLLVEEIGCSVDTQGYVRIQFPDLPTGHGICQHETPIHVLVRGRTHWWQTSEALPYLVRDRGAKLEVKDCFHSTPLAVAVSHMGRPTFNRGAVETLLELGADANAADMSWTCESPEMTDLLLSRGAAVKPTAILAAVRSRNCEVLNMLLSRGGDVNKRDTAIPVSNTPIYIETMAPPREKWTPISEIPKRLQRDDRLGDLRPPPPTESEMAPFTIASYVPEREMYPLDYAAHLFSRQPEVDEYLDNVQISMCLASVNPNPARPLPQEELTLMIETLIEHGADVMATYELPDGSTMSIKDRIVLRAKDAELRFYRPWLDRPQLARRILELCKTTYEGEMPPSPFQPRRGLKRIQIVDELGNLMYI